MSESGIDADAFNELMERCGPFEARPLLAVAVSGGADSMALALLAHAWAQARKGRIVALTVNHGLRPEARAEARQVARWMKARGILHRTLTWRGAKPNTGVQAAAREARYRLLPAWCRAEGALHLLLAHTRDDQAETVLLRLAAGSGPHGLAAMPPVYETSAVRIVRPLLDMPRARLRATLQARDQDWIEDPSNRDERYARIRVRRLLQETDDTHAAAIARAAGELGRFRAAQERKIAGLLARAVALLPEGYARLDAEALSSAPTEVGWRALSALLATIGGLQYPPRGEAVRELHAALAAGQLGRGRTLARCRLVPDGKHCLVVREAREIERCVARSGDTVREWDRRFDLSHDDAGRIEVSGLGAAGWAEIVARQPALRDTALPFPARLALPALRDRSGIVEVPALNFRRRPSRKKTAIAAFRPRRLLAAAVFAAPLSA